MWWFPRLCILIVIVVACIFQPLATTLRRRWTDHHGQLGPEGQQCELRETPAFPTERERQSVVWRLLNASLVYGSPLPTIV